MNDLEKEEWRKWHKFAENAKEYLPKDLRDRLGYKIVEVTCALNPVMQSYAKDDVSDFIGSIRGNHPKIGELWDEFKSSK